MKIKVIFFYSFLFLTTGCFDVFTEKQVELVGHISLISSNKPEDNEYTMVLNEDGINENVIYEHVKDVIGNDSVLMVKCVNSDCYDSYYKITHDKGKSPVNAININLKNYLQQISVMKTTYSFHDDTPCAAYPTI